MEKKPLPLGMDDFKEIREKGCYFVDKSMFISEILDKMAKVTLLPRPRRFGKTLNMSMLHYFFSIENRAENRELFKNLAISESDKMRYQGEYPVIYISLKDIKVNTWRECFISIKNLLRDLYESKKHVRNSLSEIQKKIFDDILNSSDEGDYLNSLKHLSNFLEKHYGKKVIILIDEYDTPLITAHGKGYYEDAITFFRNFYSAGLKGNLSLEFSVLTGILRLAKESIFSGLNNLVVSTILDRDFQYFGLKEDEVEKLLRDYGLEYELEEVKKWYNGYLFGSEKVYNPWSLINFSHKNTLESYWVNTSDNALIKQLLAKTDRRMRENLETIFSGEELEETINDNISFSDMDENDTLWSLMLFSGYLTYSGSKVSPITGSKTYFLRIPNYEVKSFFRNNFIKTYSSGQTTLTFKMMEDLYLGNIEGFSKKFREIYFSAVSYHDRGENEKYYHHFMLGLLATLGDLYTVKSNREEGDGRYDVSLEPKDKKNCGLIFEFKLAGSREELRAKAEEALQQIEEKRYGVSMKMNGVEKVIRIGMAFCGKDVEIVSRSD
ncbi:MAG: AAA family ATPase [Fusobacteriaceae bacterium]